MPVIILEIAAAVGDALMFVLRPVLPYLVRLWKFLGIQSLIGLLWAWIQLFFSKLVAERAAAVFVVGAGLALWAGFLATFWTTVFGLGIRELFVSNPFVGAPAGALYLASHAFPLKFMCGITVAYIQWKLTYIHAAIVLNRLLKLLIGF